MDELQDAKFRGSTVTTTPEAIVITHGRMRRLGGSTPGVTIAFDQIIQVSDEKPKGGKPGTYEIITRGYAPTGAGRPHEIWYTSRQQKEIQRLSKLITARGAAGNDEVAASGSSAPVSFTSVRIPDGPVAFNGWKVDGRKLRGEGQEFDLIGAKVEFEAGANAGSRITAARVVTGGVLFGPIGAVAGGLLRKNRNKVYIVISFTDGSTGLIEAPAKKETDARKFANHLKSVANSLSS
ncbi:MULTISPECIES: hypothetical protein [unclassified Brevibacterium]|uniref:hypothetical protein n=1 Tax=unclassified Brevibacterium TaxID=2614124 RepID=UPI000C692CC7|nr:MULTISPECIES: hypothetical protein [unclassified Brevibacterium]SMX91228.1 hypothetical protein BSP239C_02259 [Brevibacterium sp. 239c]